MRFTRPIDIATLGIIATVLLSVGYVTYTIGHGRGYAAGVVEAEMFRAEADAAQAKADEAVVAAATWKQRAEEASATAAEASKEASALAEDLENLSKERLRRDDPPKRTTDTVSRGSSTRTTIPKATGTSSSSHKKPASVERWRGLVERYFPGRVESALCVMNGESRGNPNAKNSSSGASGLFQQMPKYWAARAAQAGFAGASIFDPTANVAVSSRLSSRGSNWSHWSCKPCGACRGK